ncbi:MAG: Cell division coordinator CpoB [Herminiimonas sp.]|nr:Cell division coordinator CpoB [Herminiimonas sp.]
MKTIIKSTLTAALTAAFCCAPLQAHAGLFDDDEARKAILDIRARIDNLNNRLDGKADKTTNLDLAAQNEQLRQEIAKLRGQVEVLANELANEQRRQKDFYTDLDTRLRKMEPQKATVDGREVEIEPAEQKTYETALALFKAGDYKNASAAFSSFLRNYPQSGFAASANYWLGNTYYAQRDYRNAITSQQMVVKNYPDNPKAPDALLNIASCYTELRDKAAAKKALEALVAQYPDSAAARTAKERLASLR